MTSKVYKTLEMPGLASFTAYTNRSVKVNFEDRTLLRFGHGSDVLHILNRFGEELTFNLSKPN